MKKSCPKSNWENYPNELQMHVDAMRNKIILVIGTDGMIHIPRQTVRDYLNRLVNHRRTTGKSITVKEILSERLVRIKEQGADWTWWTVMQEVTQDG